MQISFRLTKTCFALSIIAVTLTASSVAWASGTFDDVPDEAFYAEPVEWAFENGITTGKTSTLFAPLDDVTRGEAVTFLQRYDDNVVAPALSGLTEGLQTAESEIGDNHANAAANSAAIAELENEARAYWAVVLSDGTVSDSSHPATVTGFGGGLYIVGFDGIDAWNSVEGDYFCVGTVQLGSVGFATSNYAATADPSGLTEFHLVTTYNTAGVPTERAFRFVATC